MLPSNLLAYKTDSLWNELGVKSSWLDNRLTFNAAVFDAAAAKARIDAQLDKDYPELDALYKDIHAHPELGF